MPEVREVPIHARVRKLALAKLVAGLLGIYLLWPLGLMELLQRLQQEKHDNPSVLSWVLEHGLLLLMSVPFVVLGIGLVELTLGKPFWQLSSAWNQMEEGKRTRLILLLFGLIFGFLALWVYLS